MSLIATATVKSIQSKSGNTAQRVVLRPATTGNVQFVQTIILDLSEDAVSQLALDEDVEFVLTVLPKTVAAPAIASTVLPSAAAVAASPIAQASTGGATKTVTPPAHFGRAATAFPAQPKAPATLTSNPPAVTRLPVRTALTTSPAVQAAEEKLLADAKELEALRASEAAAAASPTVADPASPAVSATVSSPAAVTPAPDSTVATPAAS